MKIRTLRGASALALLFGVGGTAFAQQTVTTTQPAAPAPQVGAVAQVDQTAPPDAAAADRVVITGSLIATTPEDAAKPVEVFTNEDLKQQGTPSVTEFVRSLTASYGDDLGFGQANADIPETSGFGNANLRGLGSNATLVLMNGQKLAPWNGAFGADINTVSMEALEAVEVLKGGASATYGAGAVGGVINFRTRRDVDAPQISVEKQFYDGSDGYYKVDFLTGWVGDTGNLLISLSQSHEDSMLMTERDFSNQPFNINPGLSISPTQTLGMAGSQPGSFQTFNSNFHTGTGTIAPFLIGASANPATLPGIRDMRTNADCTAIGGQIANVMQPNANLLTIAPNANCIVPSAPFFNLINENTTSKAYAEMNADITDSMEVYFSVNYSMSATTAKVDPSKLVDVQAIDRSATGGGRNGFFPLAGSNSLCVICNYVVPVQVQTFTPPVGSSATQAPGTPTGVFFRNPFIDDFITRTNSAAVVPSTGALYMGLNWRPFMAGGNPFYEDGLREEKYERENFQVTSGMKGTFTEDTWVGSLLNGINYEFSGQYNQYMQSAWDPDLFAARLQNAMLGYGGAECNAVDRVPTDYTSAASYNRTVGTQSNTVPGTNGCQWFNPFASGWQTSIINGAANPQFNSGTPNLAPNSTPRPTGYANPVDLIDWMWGTGATEYKLESATFNATLSGAIPESTFALPGGEIGWAAGTEWRQVEGRRSTRDDVGDEETMNTQPCVWPDPSVVDLPAQQNPSSGMPGCTTSGARYGDGELESVTVVPPSYSDTQTISLFGEISLPILDTVNLQANVRHEEFNGGDLKGDIYTVAGKWDITDNLWIRADYGTNYRADEALELNPGEVTNGTTTQNRFGTGTQKNQTTTVSSGITPEDDRTFNFGVGWESDLGEGRIRANVQFFEAIIDGQVATTSATTILNNIFGNNTAACQLNRSDPVACGVNNVATGLPTLANGNDNSGQFVNCGARLLAFVELSGTCVPGVTTSTSLTEIKRFQVNGPGFITNGVEYKVDFAYPLFDGTLTASLEATQNLVYKSKGYDVNGVLFELSGNRLGYSNGVLRTGSESRRWRANGALRWSNDVHNIGLRANYSSGTSADFPEFRSVQVPIIANNIATAANETVFSTYGIAPKEYLDFDVSYIYTAPFWEELELRATILNIFDKDPLAQQIRSGYYSATGNPRGRIIEVGVTKKF